VFVSSMTGFSQSEGQKDICSWRWELKSLNARGLDVRCRLPNGFEDLEKDIRGLISKFLKRGFVNVNLVISQLENEQSFRLNTKILGEVLEILPKIKLQFPDAKPLSTDGLLAICSVIESTNENFVGRRHKNLILEVEKSFKVALDDLLDMRKIEGASLKRNLITHLKVFSGLIKNARKIANSQQKLIRERLKNQINSLLKEVTALTEDRLSQEIVLLMAKADICEELDRLKAHELAASDIIKKGGPIGRKLDFLCQEFNREVNTICSKSLDVNLTNIGLEMKSCIEQFREQIQNIE